MRLANTRVSGRRAGPGAEPGRLNIYRAGASVRQAVPAAVPMRAMEIVVIHVFAEHQPKVPFTGDQHPVQALAAGAGNPSLRAFARGA